MTQRYRQESMGCDFNACELLADFPDPVIRYDGEGEAVWHNARAREMLSASPGAEYDRHLRRALETGEPVEFEFVPEEGERQFLMTFVPRREEGEVVGLLATGKEITRYKAAEWALQEQEARYVLLFQAGQVAFALFSLDQWVYREVNESFLRWTGYSREEVVDRPGVAFWVDEEERNRFIGELRERGKAENFEFRYRRKEGSIGTALAFGTLVEQGGEWCILTEVYDITEQKQHRLQAELLETAIRHSGEAMYIVDPSREFRFTFVNDGACRMTGYSREELLEMTPKELDPAFDPGRIRDGEKGGPAEGGRSFETVHRRKDGGFCPVEVHAFTVSFHGAALAISVVRDITERKRTEALLEENRWALAEAQRIAHLGSWEVDVVNDVLTWSDETYRIWEIDKERFDATFAAFLETVHPEDRERVSKAYNDSLLDRSPYEVEHRLLFPDGRIKYIQERGRPYYDATGKPIRFIGTSLDITERKKMDESIRELNAGLERQVEERTARLAETEKKLSEIVAATPGVNYVFELSPDGKMAFTYMAPGIEELMGVSAEAALEDTEAMTRLTYPDNREELFESIAVSARELTPWQEEFPVTHREKGERWIEGRSNPQRREDGSVVWYGFFHDVTDRKRAEETIRLLETALDATEETVWLFDASDGRLLYVNDGASRMLGYRREELLESGVIGVIDREYTEEDLAADMERLLGNQQVAFQRFHTARDGRKIPVEVCSVLFETEAKSYVLSTARDVSGMKAAEARLREREEKFSRLFTLSPAAISIFSLERNLYLEVNDSLLLHTGYTREEIVGKTSADVGIFAYPEEREEFFRKIREEGFVRDLEFSYRSKEGRIGHAVFYASVMVLDGERCLLAHSYDISARKKVEALRRERLTLEERHARIAAAAPGAHYIFEKLPDGNLHFSYLSPGIEALFGLDPERAADFPAVTGRIHPEDWEEVMENIAVAAQEGAPWREEFRVLHPEKGEVWIESHSSCEVREDGAVVWYGFFQEITGRKQAEAALREWNVVLENRVAARTAELERKEREFRTLAENLPDPIFRYDTEGRRIYVNPVVERLTGTPAAQFLGKTATEERIVVSGDDLRVLQSVRKVVETGEPVVAEFRFVAPDGREYWFENTHVPEFAADGSISGVLAVAHDVTALKQLEESEERFHAESRLLRTVLDSSPDLIWFKDPQGRYLACNAALEQFFGATEAELAGKSDYDFMDRSAADLCARSDEAALRAGGVTVAEETVAGPEGSERVLEIRKAPVRRKDGEIKGILGIARDVTGLREAERQVARFMENTQAFLYTFLLSPEGKMRFPFASPGIEALFGLSPEAVKENLSPLHDRIHPEDREVIEKAVAESAEAMVPLQSEVRVLVPGEPEKWVEFRSVPVRQGDGSILWHGIAQEITERKEMEAFFFRREEMFRALVENSPDAVLRFDPSGTCLYANPKLEEYFGVSAEAMAGKRPAQLSWLEEADKLEEALEEAVRTELPGTLEMTLLRPGGERMWAQVRIVPEFEPDGRVASLLAVGRNITRLKKQEETLAEKERAFRTLTNNLPDNIIRWDRDGRYLYINPVHERTLGNRASQVLGKTIGDLFPHHTEVVAAIARIGETGEEAITVFQPVPGENGETQIHEVKLIAEKDARGNVVSVLGLGRDITERKRLEETLERNRAFLVEAQRIAQMGSWELDLAANRLSWSDEIFRIFEIDRARFAASYEGFLEAIHPDDREKVDRAFTQSLENRTPYEIEHRLLMADGRVKHVLERGETRYGDDGRPLGTLGTVHDITDRKEMEEALAKREREFRALAENIPDTIARYDRQLRRTYANQVFARLAGAPAEALLGKKPTDTNPASGELYERKMEEALETGKEQELELVWPGREGKSVICHIRIVPERNDAGETVTVLAVGRDITLIKEAEERVAYLARHDDLTGLPNRHTAREAAERAIRTARSGGGKMGLVFLDLDNFKMVNDSLGHTAGDALLEAVARRLGDAPERGTMISRLGGDEFLMVLTEVENGEAAVEAAQKILRRMEKPFPLGGRLFSVSMSAGIALFPEDGENFETLLKKADMAMYSAKEEGRNTFRRFALHMEMRTQDHLQLQHDLKRGLENREFALHYQPQIDLATGRIAGVEALLRWNHPERGMVPPLQFIPVAESSGLIVPLGEWVIREACRQGALWQERMELTVAVNVSAVQFRRGNLEQVVVSALRESGLAPRLLELELTESILIQDIDTVLQAVRRLGTLGVKLSIDDFGTGYSSLAYLKKLKVDKLKIDQSFVRGLTRDVENAHLVRTILQMARSFNLKTIAEGVEDEETYAILRLMECDEGQGYHFDKPLEAKALEKRYLGGNHG